MKHFNIGDATQQALSFLRSQLTYVETIAYETQYPDILYRTLIPVNTSGPEWMVSKIFVSTDKFGRAQWFNHMADDVPRADISRNQFVVPIQMAAIGYGYTLEEVAQSAALNTPITAERAQAAIRASEEFIDQVTLQGDTNKGWKGLFNDTGITIQTIPADGTGSSTAFSAKTPAQIMRDINSALSGIYTSSATVEMADTILWPINVAVYLASVQVPNTTMTIWQWVEQNNQYSFQSGQPITMRAVRGLDTAGAGGITRAVFYRRDPSVLQVHIPMPHRFMPVYQDGPIKFEVPGIFRLGGLEIRRPGAVRYMDGV
jgi:hypothetical protein